MKNRFLSCAPTANGRGIGPGRVGIHRSRAARRDSYSRAGTGRSRSPRVHSPRPSICRPLGSWSSPTDNPGRTALTAARGESRGSPGPRNRPPCLTSVHARLTRRWRVPHYDLRSTDLSFSPLLEAKVGNASPGLSVDDPCPTLPGSRVVVGITIDHHPKGSARVRIGVPAVVGLKTVAVVT